MKRKRILNHRWKIIRYSKDLCSLKKTWLLFLWWVKQSMILLNEHAEITQVEFDLSHIWVFTTTSILVELWLIRNRYCYVHQIRQPWLTPTIWMDNEYAKQLFQPAMKLRSEPIIMPIMVRRTFSGLACN